MQFQLNIDFPALPKPIDYNDSILLIGSCFTEHMSDRLQQHKFNILSNPHGILFNPLSVAASLDSYATDRRYEASDLFYLNELWNSWDHHSRFSNVDRDLALGGINASQALAGSFVKKATWVMVTLGSAFQYHLKENDQPVANNHRAPANWFEKKLITIDKIYEKLKSSLHLLRIINPKLKFIFTISPVRHIRDGVIENNKSKARLIEVVHELCQNEPEVYYFPAYELMIDVLRDYRFYDIDMVHPNFQATGYIWEQFVNKCLSIDIQTVMNELKEIHTAYNHRTRFPETAAHRKFKEIYIGKITQLNTKYPFFDLSAELEYFRF